MCGKCIHWFTGRKTNCVGKRLLRVSLGAQRTKCLGVFGEHTGLYEQSMCITTLPLLIEQSARFEHSLPRVSCASFLFLDFPTSVAKSETLVTVDLANYMLVVRIGLLFCDQCSDDGR